MSSLGSLFGGKSSLSQYTKNSAIQDSLNNLTKDYNSTQTQDATDLNSYIKNYLSPGSQGAKWQGQETGAIDRYYNGDVARQMAELRARQLSLGNQAVAQALAYQRGNVNRSIAGGGGGGDSSYNNRLAIGSAAPLLLQNQENVLGQERSDDMMLNQAPIDLAGKRASLAAAMGLAPIQLRQNQVQFGAGILPTLANVNNANNQYSMKFTPSTWNNIFTGTGDTLNDAAGIVGSFYGMGSLASGKVDAGPTGGGTTPGSTMLPSSSSGGSPEGATSTYDPFASQYANQTGLNWLDYVNGNAYQNPYQQSMYQPQF